MPITASYRRLIDYKELTDHERKNLMILEAVRRRAPIARAEIARITNFNVVTVTSYVDQYLKKGILKEVGMDISSGGRKPTLVDLNLESSFSVGVGLNAVDMIAVLCDLKGKVLADAHVPRPMQPGEKVIDEMLDLVEGLLKKSGVTPDKIHGVGIGFPGIFNREAHTVRWPTGLGEKDLTFSLSLNEKFQKRFGFSVIVENDANTAVFSEQWHSNSLDDVENAIYLYSGAGCGLLLNGRIYRGDTGSAGEWLFDMSEEHPERWVKQSMCSGSWAIDLDITAHAQEGVGQHKDSQIHSLCDGDPQKIDLKMIAKAAQGSDAFALQLIKDAGTDLGRKASALVNLLNPEVLIIGGGVELFGMPFINAVSDQVRAASVSEATERLKVVPSHLGENCVPLGAAALIIQNYFVGG